MILKKPSLVLDDRSTKSLITFQFYYTLLLLFLIDNFNLPTGISYVTDLVNIMIFLYLLIYRGKGRIISSLKCNIVLICIIALFVTTLFTSLINLVNPVLVIWSARNYFRFFPYFFSCIFFEDDVGLETKLNRIIGLQKINFLIAMYQFFVKGISGDHLGGMFGTSSGCNDVTNIFACIVTIYVLIAYTEGKRISTFNFILTLGSCIVVTVMAEIKVYFVEFAVILLAYAVISKTSFKKILIVVFSIVALCGGFIIFTNIFPQSVEYLTSMERMLEYGSGTDSSYALGRLGSYANINKLFFHDDILKNLFGYGFGSCECSTYSFFTSDFYNKYGYLNYRWFSNQMWFLQCGFSGVISYISTIISIFVWNLILPTEQGTLKSVCRKFSMIFCLIMIIAFYYDQSCNVEIAYVSFYMLSSTFVATRVEKEKDIKMTE